MSWFKTRQGPVYATGGLAEVYRGRGYPESEDAPMDGEEASPPSGSWEPSDEPDAGPVLTVEHQAHADLSPDEQADVDTLVDEEG